MTAARAGWAAFGRGVTGFGRGSIKLLRPAVFPLAALGGGALLVNQVGRAADDVGRAINPPVERVPVDLDGDGVPESYLIADPKTGRQTTFGQPPSHEARNDRQEVQKWTLVLVGVGVVGAVVVLTAGRR